MSKRIAVGATLVGLVLVMDPPLRACGDKFLVVGRGVRAQRMQGAGHKGSLLVYLDPSTKLADAMRASRFEAHAKLAGHRLRRVESREALNAELASGRYDLVVTGLDDAKALAPQVSAASSHPGLLPVVDKGNAADLEAAEKAYGCALRSPSKRDDFLSVIDDALGQRAKQGAATR